MGVHGGGMGCLAKVGEGPRRPTTPRKRILRRGRIVVLKGKANSPAKTFIGEMPAVLNLETPNSNDRVTLLKKGSYRAVYQHPTDRKLVWKVGDHGEEAAWLRLYRVTVTPCQSWARKSP